MSTMSPEAFEPADTAAFQRFADGVETDLASINYFAPGHVWTRYVAEARNIVEITWRARRRGGDV